MLDVRYVRGVEQSDVHDYGEEGGAQQRDVAMRLQLIGGQRNSFELITLKLCA